MPQVDAHTLAPLHLNNNTIAHPTNNPLRRPSPVTTATSHAPGRARPLTMVGTAWYRPLRPSLPTVRRTWRDPDGRTRMVPRVPHGPTRSHTGASCAGALRCLCYVTYSYGGDKWARRLAIAHTTKSGQGHHDTPNATTYMYSVTPNDTCTLNPRTSTTLARPTHNHKTAPCSMGVDPRHAKCENELSSSVVRSAAVSPPPTVAVSVYQYNYNCIITISTRHHLPRCVRRSQR